jgi:hypothetical protein
MKKTTAKSSKSPAPATKEKSTVAPKAAPKKPATKKVAVQPGAAAAVAAVARVAAPVVAAKPAVVAKATVSKPQPTVITAKIDIGFGNTLFVRGEGAGLSWDRGLPMANLGHDTWQVELGESTRPLVFKFLVNDLSWSTGEDCSLAAGASQVFTPAF